MSLSSLSGLDKMTDLFNKRTFPRRRHDYVSKLFLCLQALASHIGASSCARCTTSELALCLWSAIAWEDSPRPWGAAPTQLVRKKLPVTSSQLQIRLDQIRSALAVASGWKISPSVYPSSSLEIRFQI